MSDEQPDDEVVTIVPATVTVRRAPKFGAFMLVGAVLGGIVTLILTAAFPNDEGVSFGALFGYFALYGVVIGVVVGALLAIILDRVSRSRTREAAAERTTVDPAPMTGQVEE